LCYTENKTKEGFGMVHLVYCDDKEKVLEKILSNAKTMVIRGAAGRKIPHSRVFPGEILYFMKKGTGMISATAAVSNVLNFSGLTDDEIRAVLDEHQSRLNLSDKQRQRWHKKCLCLVEFEGVREIEPLVFDHQSNMDDWLILDKIEDVVAGTSIPFDYSKSKLK
jgi:hypothetical protein